jgi:UDPglucose 6-dehydrogenase
VLCVDVDEQKVQNLKKGIIPIFEPGLDDVIKRNVEANRLDFTTDMDEAVAHSEIQFIAVGTPPGEDGSADMQYVAAVAKTIAERMTERKVIVNKSTVPVGTGDMVEQVIADGLQARKLSLPYAVISNPEFLKEGAALDDFMKPDRIVIGSDNTESAEQLRQLYAPFNRNHDRMVLMDVRSAELTKYAANALLATKISFMNELSNLADLLGADIEKVRNGIGSDPRIGYHFIYPGCGYGGSCFPKDVQALERTAAEVGYNARLLSAVEAVNNDQKGITLRMLERHFDGDLDGRTIALWGLAFKPNTDDMRAAPSRTLIEGLWARGATVQAFDPEAMDEARRIYGNDPRLILASDPYAALDQADALAVVTEWNVFRSPDLNTIKQRLKQAVVIDGRNLYDPAHMQQQGFRYYCVGRPQPQ